MADSDISDLSPAVKRVKKQIARFLDLERKPSLFIADHFQDMINEIDIECETVIEELQKEIKKIRENMILADEFDTDGDDGKSVAKACINSLQDQIDRLNMVREDMIKQLRNDQKECLANTSTLVVPSNLSEEIRNYLTLLDKVNEDDETFKRIAEYVDSECYKLERRAFLNNTAFYIKNQNDFEQRILTPKEEQECKLSKIDRDELLSNKWTKLKPENLGYLVKIDDVFLTDLEIILCNILLLKNDDYLFLYETDLNNFNFRSLLKTSLKRLKEFSERYDEQINLLSSERQENILNLTVIYQFFKFFYNNLNRNTTTWHKFNTFADSSSSKGNQHLIEYKRDRINDDRALIVGLSFEGSDWQEFNAEIFGKFQNLSSLNLSKNNLKKISSSIFKNLFNLTTLIIDDNELESIESNQFNLPSLEELSLSANIISSIHPEAFNGLTRLKRLNLCSNKLKRLDDNVFSHLRSLQKLHLTQNGLEMLGINVFYGLESLKILNLDLNSLSCLTNYQFKYLRNLQELTLLSNRITRIEECAFSELGCLLKLNLQNNLLESLNARQFSGLNKLRSLNLANNKIEFIDTEAFLGLKELKSLTLRSNPIEPTLVKNYDDTKLDGFKF